MKTICKQKTGNAIRALGRITTLYSSSRKSSSGSSLAGSSVSSPSAIPPSFNNHPGVTHQESLEDSVFGTPPPSASGSASVEAHLPRVNSPLNNSTGIGHSEKRDDFANKAKYDESCRSDSGIGGEALSSGNFSLE